MGTAYSHRPGDISGNLDQPPVEAAGRSSVSPTAQSARPYPPSWIDRLTDWVRDLPFPAWAFYLAVGLVLSAVYLAVLLWSTNWPTQLFPIYSIVLYSLLNGLTCVYLPGMVHYLDDYAAAALTRFRPVLTVDEAGYSSLHYQLTTLPPRSALIAALLGVGYTAVALLMTYFTISRATGEASLLLGVFVWTFNLVMYVFVAVVLYHTLHQLRMVNAIYTKYTRINLFQQGPLYSLSGLTARTAVGIAIPTYLWFQANSLTTMGNTASDIIQTTVLAVVILVTFVSPLLGAHRLLEREKQRLQDEAARSIEDTIAELNRRVAGGDPVVAGEMKEALEALVIEQSVIDKLRTWPWRTETVRGLGAAFVLPIFIWLVQRILERLGV